MLRMLALTCLILAAAFMGGCSRIDRVVYELPPDFQGPLVLYEDDSAPKGTFSQRSWTIKVTGSRMGVAGLKGLYGRYLKYEATRNGRSFELAMPISGAQEGFFGGMSSHRGERYYYFGSASDAARYFDEVTGKHK